jgi:hypothetical protein
MSRKALGPTQHLILWLPEFLSPGIMQPEREDDQLPSSSIVVKNVCSYTFFMVEVEVKGKVVPVLN